MIGAPVSGLLLGLDGAMGLKGWQWLFIVEGVPSVLLGLVTWFYLTDQPEHATWLTLEAEGVAGFKAQGRDRRQTGRDASGRSARRCHRQK